MSFTVVGASTFTERTRLTDNTATTVLGIDRRTTLISIALSENNGGTPTVALDVFDGTSSRYLQKTVTLAAGGRTVIDLSGEVIELNELVRATSSDTAGHVDVAVTYVNPHAANQA
jgi:hypothetical protein